MGELSKEKKGGGKKVYTEADCTITQEGSTTYLHFPDGVTWGDIKHFVLAGARGYSTSGGDLNYRKNTGTGKPEYAYYQDGNAYWIELSNYTTDSSTSFVIYQAFNVVYSVSIIV